MTTKKRMTRARVSEFSDPSASRGGVVAQSKPTMSRRDVVVFVSALGGLDRLYSPALLLVGLTLSGAAHTQFYARSDELLATPTAALAQLSPWTTLAAIPVILALLGAASTAHEFGHALAARRAGVPNPAVVFRWRGLFPTLGTHVPGMARLAPLQRAGIGIAGLVAELWLAGIAAGTLLAMRDRMDATASALLPTLLPWIVPALDLVLLLNLNALLSADGRWLAADLRAWRPEAGRMMAWIGTACAFAAAAAGAFGLARLGVQVWPDNRIAGALAGGLALALVGGVLRSLSAVAATRRGR